MARAKVVDESLYVRPDGGRCARYRVAVWLSTRRRWFTLHKIYYTRKEARDAARTIRTEVQVQG